VTDPDFIERGPSLDPDERDAEAPVADVWEQATTADPADDPTGTEPTRALEVNDWDALEQARVIDDPDDYSR
jgi:hypothetical protein